MYATKQADLQGSSRPNGLFSGFWSAENHFVRNKTGVFTRFKQTKWAIFLHLVCFFAKKQTESRRFARKKTSRAFPNRRICKARADQTGCSAAFGLPKITLYATKQAYLLDSSRPNGLFSCIWSAFLRKNKLNQGASREKKRPAHFQTGKKKKRPALLQAERNFSRCANSSY